MIQYVVEKIKNNLRNLQAENDPKFKKRARWPKNLVSYKKENVYSIFHRCFYVSKARFSHALVVSNKPNK